jgi:glycosyltransferase involved in cell wall biosynthesis
MIDVILPVLDEVDALGWVLPRMPAGYRALVVDNGSSDGSADRARALGATVVREERRGFGSACFAGLQAATAPIVCFMDCDASLDPADLPKVAVPVLRGEVDMMLGARRGERDAFAVHARLANKFLAASINRRTGLCLHDLGPMRAARREGLLGLALLDRRSGWPLEMVLTAAAAGWRVADVPVPYRPRVGASKVTGTVRGTMQAIRDMRHQLVSR